jgi:hypothetical protein
MDFLTGTGALQLPQPTGRSPPRSPQLPVSRGATALGMLRDEQRTRSDRMEVGDGRSRPACARADRPGSAPASRQQRAPRPPLPTLWDEPDVPVGLLAHLGVICREVPPNRRIAPKNDERVNDRSGDSRHQRPARVPRQGSSVRRAGIPVEARLAHSPRRGSARPAGIRRARPRSS